MVLALGAGILYTEAPHSSILWGTTPVEQFRNCAILVKWIQGVRITSPARLPL